MKPPSPAARSELVPTGTLRVGINLGNFLLTAKDAKKNNLYHCFTW